MFAALVWQGINLILKFVEYFTLKFIAKDEDGDGEIDQASANASNMLLLMARIILWILGILFLLSNLGIEITSLIAGLGIGGIAVAFALQGILSDLFASFSIYFDRPFQVGDFVIIGTDSGTVEKIGIKSTRIRTLQGEELVISNAELTTTRVQNFKRMMERRIVARFGITYETSHVLVEKVPDIVRTSFGELTGCRLDRVHFTTFGDSALTFEVVYFITSSDYTQYLDIQQKFNLNLMRHFSAQGIEFAYPTQVVYTKPLT
jgi:small-conductance mechanosensitive channel